MTVTINGTTGIAGVDGSAATPAVQGGDANTGMFFPAADTIAFGEGGVESMRIDSSGYMQGTVNGLGAGRIPAMQYYRLNSGVAGANNTSAQSVLGVGVTLVGSTQYDFEQYAVLAKTAGATGHTVGFGFGGTATVNNILFSAIGGDGNALPTASNTATFLSSNTVSNTVLTGSSTNLARTVTAIMRGTVSISGGGTFTPQYTLSAAPGGAYTTQIGSYFRIWPLGASGSNVSIGTWA
jgi:hypothetical protein